MNITSNSTIFYVSNYQFKVLNKCILLAKIPSMISYRYDVVGFHGITTLSTA